MPLCVCVCECVCVCVCVCAWEIFEVGNIYNILIKWQWTKYIFNI